jgi:hypothetical protein
VAGRAVQKSKIAGAAKFLELNFPPLLIKNLPNEAKPIFELFLLEIRLGRN